MKELRSKILEALLSALPITFSLPVSGVAAAAGGTAGLTPLTL